MSMSWSVGIIYAILFLPLVSLKLQITLSESEKYFLLTERSMRILGTCPHYLIEKTVVVTDSNKSVDWSHKFFKRTTLMQVNFDVNNYAVFPNYGAPQNPQVYFLISSATNIEATLLQLRSSSLWYYPALFLMLDTDMEAVGCSNAELFLTKGWKVNLLWCIFLCFDPLLGYKVYTLNPYTRFAPKPWTEMKSHISHPNNTSWYLYSRKLLPGKKMGCWDLLYDKTKALGGYKTKVAVFAFADMINSNNTSWEALSGLDMTIAETVFNKINTSVAADIFTDFTQYGDVDSDGICHGILKNLLAGDFDIQMNSRYILNKLRIPITYPHMQSEVSVLTRFAGFQTAPMKIVNFVDYKILIAIFCVVLLTIIILTISSRRGVGWAFLNVLRIITGSSIEQLPQRSFFRVHLLMVMILFLMTNAIFQSRLASILTSPIENTNIDDLNSLEQSSFVVYYYPGIENLLNNTPIQQRSRYVNDFDCIYKVVTTQNTACVGDLHFLIKARRNYPGLYVSKHVLNTQFSSYAVRPDWPLRHTVSNIIYLLKQTGLIDYWQQKVIRPYIRQWNVLNTRSEKVLRKLKIADLIFAFNGLALGLLLSTFVFLGELAVSACTQYYYRKEIVHTKTMYPFVN